MTIPRPRLRETNPPLHFLLLAQVGVGPDSCAGDECNAASALPSLVEQRTHFGLWAVLSSPLTLSMDLTNSSVVDAVWPIITNVDAIAVNQAWAGNPGGVFEESSDEVTLQVRDELCCGMLYIVVLIR